MGYSNIYYLILEPPGVPSNIRVSVTNDTATITWTAPIFVNAIFGKGSVCECVRVSVTEAVSE